MCTGPLGCTRRQRRGPLQAPPEADQREPADAEGAISAARAGAALVAGWVIIGADRSAGARRRPLAECLLIPFRVGARFPRKPGRTALFPGMPAEQGARRGKWGVDAALVSRESRAVGMIPSSATGAGCATGEYEDCAPARGRHPLPFSRVPQGHEVVAAPGLPSSLARAERPIRRSSSEDLARPVGDRVGLSSFGPA